MILIYQVYLLLESNKFLREKNYKNGSITKKNIKKAKKTCEINPKCSFKQITQIGFLNDNSNSSRLNMEPHSVHLGRLCLMVPLCMAPLFKKKAKGTISLYLF